MRRGAAILLTVAVFINIGVFVAQTPILRACLDPDFRAGLHRFGTALWVTERHYYDEDLSSHDQLVDAAIAGMIDSLDKHSHYIPEADFKEYQSDKKLQYVGTGFKSRTLDGEKTVTQVFPGSPAKAAGLSAGDRILKIDGKTTKGLSRDEFSMLARGPAGTTVTMFVKNADDEDRTIKITRKKITANPVAKNWVDSEGNGYLHLSNFTLSSREKIGETLPKMKTQGMRRLVLDLRDNPGGDLETMGQVAGYFLEPEKLVVTIKGRNLSQTIDGKTIPKTKLEYRAPAQDFLIKVPMAILINQYSGSAAEALSAALQVYDRATIVGETSYGKGTGQQLMRIHGSGGINLTTIKYYLSDGSSIDGIGVVPDVPVHVKPLVLESIWLQREVLDKYDPEEFKRQFGRKPIDDPQLLKAIELLNESSG